MNTHFYCYEQYALPIKLQPLKLSNLFEIGEKIANRSGDPVLTGSEITPPPDPLKGPGTGPGPSRLMSQWVNYFHWPTCFLYPDTQGNRKMIGREPDIRYYTNRITGETATIERLPPLNWHNHQWRGISLFVLDTNNWEDTYSLPYHQSYSLGVTGWDDR